MAGHKNNEIHKLGKNACVAALIKAGAEVLRDTRTATVVSQNGKKYLVSVNVKPCVKIDGELLTGKNEKMIEMLLEKQELEGCDDVLLVFYDISVRAIYSAKLSSLSAPQPWGGEMYPKTIVTHSGRIVYWPVHLIETIAAISKDEASDLALIRFQNKHPKEQTQLF